MAAISHQRDSHEIPIYQCQCVPLAVELQIRILCFFLLLCNNFLNIEKERELSRSHCNFLLAPPQCCPNFGVDVMEI